MGKKKLFFGRPTEKKQNVFVGNIASLCPTVEDFAGKLALSTNTDDPIPVNLIENYTIVGDDIECYIGVDYNLGSSTVKPFNYTAVTYYRDEGEYCKYIATDAFRSCGSLIEAKLNGVTSMGTQVFRQSRAKNIFMKSVLNVRQLSTYLASTNVIEMDNATSTSNDAFREARSANVVYIPRAATLYNNTEYNKVFEGIKPTAVIYVPISLQTANAGGVEPDVQYAIDRGCDVRYVTNFDIPDTPLPATIGVIFNDSANVSLSEPSSTNAIDYYNIYVNGVFNAKADSISASISGLVLGEEYGVTYQAVDIFYNKSEFSVATLFVFEPT